jgi:hypothetical protein
MTKIQGPSAAILVHIFTQYLVISYHLIGPQVTRQLSTAPPVSVTW